MCCCATASDFLLAVLAVVFPPIAVWVKRGICSADSLINIALCILGYVPGLVHSWYIISSYPDPSFNGYESIDVEPGRAYYYTSVYHSNRRGQQQPPRTAPPKSRGPPRVPSQSGSQRYGGVPDSQTSQQENSVVSPHDMLQPQHMQILNGGEGSSSQEQQQPPSYNDVVKGDLKVQSRD